MARWNILTSCWLLVKQFCNVSSTEFNIFVEKNAQVLELSLSSCARSQFSCTNGLCIDLLKRYPLSKMFSIKLPRVNIITFRCDFKNDCPDKSDESGCKKVDSCLSTTWKYFSFCKVRNFVVLADLDECLVPEVLGATAAVWRKQNQGQC